jgi:predicted flavoprotein YhiN
VALAFDAIVVGGGAAGLLCAIEAGKRGRRVAVLEHADRVGKKILISGGGRANFTNLHCRPENFLSANPHFAKSAFARYTPADFIKMVERHHIPYHERSWGNCSATDPRKTLLLCWNRNAVRLVSKSSSRRASRKSPEPQPLCFGPAARNFKPQPWS